MKPILLLVFFGVCHLHSAAFDFVQDSLIYADLNCDGIYNGNDAPVPYCNITTEDGVLVGMSNAGGQYELMLEGGNIWNITPEPLFGFDSNISSFSPQMDTIITSDLGMCPQTFINNLHLEVSEIYPALDGQFFNYRICVTNLGTQADDVIVKFSPNLGDSVSISDLDGANPLGNFYLWQITDLLPMQRTCYEIVLHADDMSQGEDFSFAVSTYYTDNGIQDNSPADNTTNVEGQVEAIFFPNTKYVDRTEIDYLEIEVFESLPLHYEISFGINDNDTLQDVVVVDTLSPYLDISTFSIESASHDYDFEIHENVITWTFHDLNFYPESDNHQQAGLIQYSISTIENPLLTDTILNTAFFAMDTSDYFPSNTTATSFYLCPDSVVIFGNQNFCASIGDLFLPELTDYDQYLWVLDGSPISGNDSLQPFPMSVGLHELAIIITNEACTVTGLLHIHAEDEPTLSLSEPDISVCNEVTISATSNAEVNWYQDLSYLSTGDVFIATANDTYTASAENACGILSENFEITIPEGPESAFITNDNGLLTVSETAISYAWYLDENLLLDSNVPEWTATETGNYEVQLFFASGCSLLSDASLITIGLKENSTGAFYVYPNPTGHDGFNLFGLQHASSSELRITDSRGSIIANYKVKGNSLFIETSGWAEDIYLIQLIQPDSVVSAQVVIH